MQVKVILNVPAMKNSEPYVYNIPPALESKAGVGKRVLVPLGPQLVHGFIYEIELMDAGQGVRSVVDILDDQRRLPGEILELCAWLAGECLAPIGKTIRAAFPAMLDDERWERLVIGRPLSKHALLDRLEESGSVSWTEAHELASPAELSDLIISGQVNIEPSKTTLVYSPDVQYRLNEELTKEQVARIAKRAPRQAKILEFFMKQKEPVTERRALEETGTPVLNGLVKKGLLLRETSPSPILQSPLPNNDQAAAIDEINKGIKQSRHRVFLLHGVTGSGKTEVYMRAIEKARSLGKKSLVLIPEIGLTQQITSLFEERLGPRVCVLHSRLSDNQRALEWFRIKSGEADVVIGARSAVFAPFERLGLIIMDEEQENSFYQEEVPRYSTRNVAIKRAETNGAVIILGSATPSIESYYMAEKGNYTLLKLPERIASSGKRSVELIDMKNEIRQGNRSIISGILLNGLKDCLAAGEQAIVFLNRRGYSTTAVCQECGNIISCRSCDVAMTYHRDIEKMVCHYCGRQKQRDTKCPKCGRGQIRLLGIGTQKVQEELQESLPDARITRMDADSTRGRDGHRKIIDEIKGGKTDIIVGTQMIAKGFDFPNVSLVGVISADPLMGLPDFRAREKAFQLLTQVAGRAGRGAAPGRVLIQTYDPANPLYEKVLGEDYDGFYRDEIECRHLLTYPPFSHLIRLLFTGAVEGVVEEEIGFAKILLEEMLGETSQHIDILGPAPCPRSRVKNKYRYQILLKGIDLDLMRSAARYIINNGGSSRVRVDVDIDPQVII